MKWNRFRSFRHDAQSKKERDAAAPHASVITNLLACLETVLQSLAGFESDGRRCVDLHRLAGGGITPGTGGTLLLGESSESHDRYGLINLDAVGDGIDDSVHGTAGRRLRISKFRSDLFDQLPLVH